MYVRKVGESTTRARAKAMTTDRSRTTVEPHTRSETFLSRDLISLFISNGWLNKAMTSLQFLFISLFWNNLQTPY